MRMHDPPHPGEVLKNDVLPELGITVGELAVQLGMSRPLLSRVLDARVEMTAEMDLRLSEALSQTPGLWIRM